MDDKQMCPKYESAIDILGKKWTGLIIHVLLDGPKRFRDIKKQIPEMSDRILTGRMKELEEYGILTRRVYPETPVRIEYELTEMGKDMKPVIQAIQKWGERWF
jgi:DNA-binding HxlR family transcriptional regulator